MLSDLVKMVKMIFHPDPCSFCERSVDGCLRSKLKDAAVKKSKSDLSKDGLKALGRSIPCGN